MLFGLSFQRFLVLALVAGVLGLSGLVAVTLIESPTVALADGIALAVQEGTVVPKGTIALVEYASGYTMFLSTGPLLAPLRATAEVHIWIGYDSTEDAYRQGCIHGHGRLRQGFWVMGLACHSNIR